MSPSAQRAQQHFAQLAGELGGAIQIEDLLRNGFDACPSEVRRRFSGLSTWRGIIGLKETLRRVAGFQDEVILAARSAQLMKFAAILLCRPCRKILVTDLGWLPYHRVLETECSLRHRRIVQLELAKDVFAGRTDADELTERIASHFAKNRCDGLFLTAVSNRGARLPVASIANAIGKACRFLVVDGAQSFCHVNEVTRPANCDLYIAGCHKWLGGFNPLAIGFYGRMRSRNVVGTVLSRELDGFQLDDPLFRFVERLCSTEMEDSGETVNVAPLFSSGGAAHDALSMATVAHDGFSERLKNAERVAERTESTGWRALLPHHSLRTGILLLQAQRAKTRGLESQRLRYAFSDQRVALTAYEQGIVRLSMPAVALRSDELELLDSALRRVA